MTHVHPIVHHPQYTAPLPPGHRFPMDKYQAVMLALTDQGAAHWSATHSPQPIGQADAARVHGTTYAAQVFASDLPPEATRRIGFAVTPAIVQRARLASGGTLLAARLALVHGCASNTAGGSHHAGPWGGSGYCVFNDVGIAATLLLANGEIESAAVLDLDVHQGDGTAALFADEPRVVTASIHCAANFPHRKVPGDLDVGLPIGTGDHAYLEALAQMLPKLLARKPALLFYNAGVDPHADDRLGRLALTTAGLAERDRMVRTACGSARVPLVSVMGGGYGSDAAAIGRLHAQTIAVMAGVL